METTMTTHKVASHEEWLAARAALLEREKEHTRIGDELAQQRRELPWVPVEKQYRLQVGDGPKTLAELFDGRSQPSPGRRSRSCWLTASGWGGASTGRRATRAISTPASVSRA